MTIGSPPRFALVSAGVSALATALLLVLGPVQAAPVEDPPAAPTPEAQPDSARSDADASKAAQRRAALARLAAEDPDKARQVQKARQTKAQQKVDRSEKLAEQVKAEEQAAAEAKAQAKIEALLERMQRPTVTPGEPGLTSRQIDQLIDASLSAQKVAPARLSNDAEFARRLSLDLIGKPPTPQQLRSFVTDDDPRKRAHLIDQLLASEEFGRNWARYWRDVIAFRATSERRNLIHYDTLEDWLAEQFVANRPWDEISRALISETGSNVDKGAVVLQTAHEAKEVEVAGEVSRIFLGVQIQCAQCHDHLTDPWKRQQFHEFAAFFAGVGSRQTFEKVEGQPRPRPTGMTVFVRPGKVRYAMPDLADPKKTVPVSPKFFLASESSPTPPETLSARERRALVASYITGPDNPWFAKAYINRVWTALIGEGFVTPVDDLGPDRDVQLPELFDRLAEAWTATGYDIRWLYRTILNTSAYQRQFRDTNTKIGRTTFAANCPSRLRADQIFDALTQALEIPTAGLAARVANRGPGQAQGGAGRGPGGPRGQFNALFGIDPSTPADDVLGTIPQALAFMNGPQINRAIEGGNRGGMLTRLLRETPDNRAAVQALYVKVLARRANPDELKTSLGYIAEVGDRREAFEDLLWALINSTEFVSRR